MPDFRCDIRPRGVPLAHPWEYMVANHGSGLVWRLMRECPAIVAGLLRAGFRGGWLEAAREQVLSATG